MVFTLLYTVFKSLLVIVEITSIGRISIVRCFRALYSDTRRQQIDPFVISIVRKLSPHIIFQCTIEPFDNRRFHYGIMIYVVFLKEFLHVCVVKFFSHIDLQIFRASSIVSNYLCYRCSHLVSILLNGPCMFIQYIDNGKNVMVIFVESYIRAHFDHIIHRSSYP